jgi:hypothetical protein
MREIIIVLGKTGMGKSVWTRKKCAAIPRLFVFDPLRSFQVDYCNEEQLLDFYENEIPANFRIGTSDFYSLDILGSIAMLTGNCYFVIEECAVAFEKSGRLPDWMQEIVFLGRHNNTSLIITAQRAASIPIDLRSQATRIVSFAQHEGEDVSWLKTYLGDKIKLLPQLQKLQCFDADSQEIKQYTITVD